MLISVLDALTIAPMLSAYIIPDHKEKVKKPGKIMAFWGVVVKVFRALTVVWFNAVFSVVEKSYRALISFIVNKELLKHTFNFKKETKEIFVKIVKYKFILFVLFLGLLIAWLAAKANVLLILAAVSFILFAAVNFLDFQKNKLRIAVSWKFITLVISVLIFVSAIGVAKKYLQTTFMPNAEWGEFNVGLEAKPGTSLDTMDKYSREVEELIMNDPDTELVSASIGGASIIAAMSNQTSIYVKMIPDQSKGGFLHKAMSLFSKKDNSAVPVAKRQKTTSQMKDYLRQELNAKYGQELEISINANGLGGGGQSEFQLDLVGDNIDVLYEVAQRLKERFANIPYLVDIKSNYKIGKPEIQIQFDTQKMEHLGVSSVMVGNEIRAMIDGAKAGKFRENGLEYDILVRLQENQKDITEAFNTIYVNNMNNKLVKLQNVAYPVNESAPTQIFRKDRSRYVTVEGNIAAGGTTGTVQKLARKIFNEEKSNPKNAAKWRNVEIRDAGNAEEMATMFQSIVIAGALSLIFIFMVLASLYESVITPFTIMTALPLAIIGGIISLLISNQPIDMFTMIGMIMLLGIVAKNSILLVDYIQQMRRRGMNMENSIIKAGSIRFRPILMTSFALIAGMLPTALGLSEVGQLRKGMGIVVIGGIISSTILTLIIVPAIYEYMDMFRHFLRSLFGRPRKRMIDYTEEQLNAKGL
jgi:HAE1 family hydrophobic/amphiphilic exporter-1